MYTIIKSLLINIILFGAVFSQVDKPNGSLVKEISDDQIKLEKDLAYYYFTSSNRYLAFYEGFTKKLYFYDLVDQSVSKVNLKEGRGPNEIGSLSGLAILDTIAVLSDAGNRKILRYDISSEEYLGEFLVKDRIYALAVAAGKVYAKIATQNAIFAEVDIDKKAVINLTGSSNLTIARDSRRNMYRFDGNLIANSNYLLSLRYYEPNFFGYILEEQSLIEQEYESLKGEIEYSRNRMGFVDGLPNKLQIRLRSADFYELDKIAMILEGRGQSEKYTAGTVYIFDLDTQEFLEPIQTGWSHIRHISINNSNIFAYDDERFAIKILEK